MPCLFNEIAISRPGRTSKEHWNWFARHYPVGHIISPQLRSYRTKGMHCIFPTSKSPGTLSFPKTQPSPSACRAQRRIDAASSTSPDIPFQTHPSALITKGDGPVVLMNAMNQANAKCTGSQQMYPPAKSRYPEGIRMGIRTIWLISDCEGGGGLG